MSLLSSTSSSLKRYLIHTDEEHDDIGSGISDDKEPELDNDGDA